MRSVNTGAEKPAIYLNFGLNSEQLKNFNRVKRILYKYALQNNLPFPQQSKIVEFIIASMDITDIVGDNLFSYSQAKSNYVYEIKHSLNFLSTDSVIKFNQVWNEMICYAINKKKRGVTVSDALNYALTKISNIDPKQFYQML